MNNEYEIGNLVACCAHLSVDYRTEILPRGGTFGYWACGECGRRFTPILNSLSDGRTTQPFLSSTVVAYPDRYPQEIEEPSPAPSWWSRFMGWLG